MEEKSETKERRSKTNGAAASHLFDLKGEK